MEQIWLVGKITFKEGFRNRILLGVLILSFLSSAFNLVFSQMFAHDVSKVSVDLGLSTVSIAGLAVIFFMGINLLAKDFEKRTVYMIISRPIARWQYVLGKFVGLTMMVGIAVTILGIVAAAGVKASMLMAPHHVAANYSWVVFYVSVLYSFLSLMIITALAQLFTCLSTSSYIALLITASTYFIGQNSEIIKKTLLGGSGVNKIYSVFIEMISWLFPNLQAFDMKMAAGYGLTIEWQYLLWTAGYGISYIGIILLVTVWVVNKREIA